MSNAWNWCTAIQHDYHGKGCFIFAEHADTVHSNDNVSRFQPRHCSRSFIVNSSDCNKEEVGVSKIIITYMRVQCQADAPIDTGLAGKAPANLTWRGMHTKIGMLTGCSVTSITWPFFNLTFQNEEQTAELFMPYLLLLHSEPSCLCTTVAALEVRRHDDHLSPTNHCRWQRRPFARSRLWKQPSHQSEKLYYWATRSACKFKWAQTIKKTHIYNKILKIFRDKNIRKKERY